MRIQRSLKKVAAFSGLLIVAIVSIFLLNSKSIEVSPDDSIFIRRFLNDWHINTTATEVHRNFETELAFISAIQDSVLSDITGQQPPHAYFGNVRFYYTSRQGICYDRAVLLEKLLLFYNFSFRHVYLYFGDGREPAITDFFKKHITSHAALEVKTKKGWMAIGTDCNWLGVTNEGQLMNYFDVRKELEATNGKPIGNKTITVGSSVWKLTGCWFRIVYGVYSRHGDFFVGASSTSSTSLFTNKRHFLPDYNFRMLLYNL